MSQSGRAGIAETDGAGVSSVFALEGEAQAVADRLPELLLDALRVANTVTHGIHGRRRAGTGETFWQFRQFIPASDPAAVVDWRRSASSDTLYVREREWEAAHTFWLWPDVSPSMAFRSHLAPLSKRDRAVVMTLAMAELLVRAGERIALIGLTQPMASRRAASRIAEFVGDTRKGRRRTVEPAAAGAAVALFQRPAVWRLPRPPERHRRALQRHGRGRRYRPCRANSRSRGRDVGLPRPHRVSLPGNQRPLVADRVETLRPAYQRKLAEHRASLEEITRRIGWSFLVHHTDRPAAEPLLTLIMRLQGMASDYRWKPDAVVGLGARS